MKNSAQWLDVYRETGAHQREARARLMDAWHVPVCGLFKGRIVDCAEHPMPETPETSGCWVEHKVYMLEGIILIVIELKLRFKDLRDHIAQVLLELVSAYKINSAKEFGNQPPVYALLTNLWAFYFLRYDGSKFTLYQHEIVVSDRSRSVFLKGMRSEHLFSIIVEGYVGNLDAATSRSKSRVSAGDIPRVSLDEWTKAFSFAKEAQNALGHVDRKSLAAWETSAAGGLSLLQSSVFLLPKIGSVTDWSQEQLNLEIENVLMQDVKAVS